MIERTEAIEIEHHWRACFGTDPVRPKTVVAIAKEFTPWVKYPGDITERGRGRYLVNQLKRFPDVLTIEQTDEMSYQTRLIKLGAYIDRFKVSR